MEQEIVQCHDIAAAEEICFDFQRKTVAYSEPDFRVNMFIADTSLRYHVINRGITLTWRSPEVEFIYESACYVHMKVHATNICEYTLRVYVHTYIHKLHNFRKINALFSSIIC